MAFEITRQEILKQAIALNTLWKQTRDQKYKDEEIRLRRIVLELDNFTIPSTGVSQIVAGTGISVSPVGGTGVVTITASGTAGVTQIIAGTNITISPAGGTGNVTINANLTGFVPYTGATSTVNLNTQQLLAGQTTLTTNGSTDTLTINHTSGSGHGIIVTKAGAGEGLHVIKTSGSGNAASITGGITLLSELNLTTKLADLHIVSAATWNAKQNAITLTTTGTSGASTFVSNTLNIPNYTLAGLGGQPQLNGTGFVKASGTTITYDNSTYYLASNPSGYQTTSGTVANIASGDIGDLDAAWIAPGTSIGNGFRVYRYNSSALNKPAFVDNANWLINIYSHPSGGTASYGHQIAAPDAEEIYFRQVLNGGFGSWRRLLHSGNFNTYSPTLTGTGASGTWGINITGSAGSWTTARTLTIGNTGKSVNGSANVSWSLGEIQAEYQIPVGTITNTLTDPTIRDITLSPGTMGNKFRFIPATTQEETTNGTTWTPSTRATANQLADIMLGEGQTGFIPMIPSGTVGSTGGYRLTWDVTGQVGYVFLSHLYMYMETKGNPVNITIEAFHNTTGWQTFAGPSSVSNWPGHVTFPHNTIPYSTNPSQYSQVRITFVTVRANTFDCNLSAIDWYGTYPAQSRNVESYDRNKNATFAAGLRATNLLINTSVDAGFKLDVNGSFRTTSTINATLANVSTANVVYYNTTTGLLTYGAAPSGGGGALNLNQVLLAGNVSGNSIELISNALFNENKDYWLKMGNFSGYGIHFTRYNDLQITYTGSSIPEAFNFIYASNSTHSNNDYHGVGLGPIFVFDAYRTTNDLLSRSPHKIAYQNRDIFEIRSADVSYMRIGPSTLRFGNPSGRRFEIDEYNRFMVHASSINFFAPQGYAFHDLNYVNSPQYVMTYNEFTSRLGFTLLSNVQGGGSGIVVNQGYYNALLDDITINEISYGVQRKLEQQSQSLLDFGIPNFNDYQFILKYTYDNVIGPVYTLTINELLSLGGGGGGSSILVNQGYYDFLLNDITINGISYGGVQRKLEQQGSSLLNFGTPNFNDYQFILKSTYSNVIGAVYTLTINELLSLGGGGGDGSIVVANSFPSQFNSNLHDITINGTAYKTQEPISFAYPLTGMPSFLYGQYSFVLTNTGDEYLNNFYTYTIDELRQIVGGGGGGGGVVFQSQGYIPMQMRPEKLYYDPDAQEYFRSASDPFPMMNASVEFTGFQPPICYDVMTGRNGVPNELTQYAFNTIPYGWYPLGNGFSIKIINGLIVEHLATADVPQ